MRAASPEIPFAEMPAFDIQEAVSRSEVERTRFKSLEFAHKFHVHLRPDNSGATFTTPDGTKVWRIGIRSKKAHSINILFSKFRLPEGAKVFVYNADQTEILGSYTHQNNSDLNLLPVQPVGGDEIIVEYQEPAHAAFKGEIEVGEVNHDFLGVFRATEPRDPAQSCHPNLVCYPENIEAGSGVVALVINGNTYCTGSLINNTAQDGTPYLITATHCLNDNFRGSFLANRKYDMVAGNIVAFFHYDSPVCSGNIRGTLQMTMASADSVLILEQNDISLLKLKNKPPAKYQPRYLGWNISASPIGSYHGLHHPNGGIKKVAIENSRLGGFSTFDFTNKWGERTKFTDGAHITITAWDEGATEGGSSGSPLLDRDKGIIGTLTGGQSYCSSPKGPDVYASLYKAWDVKDATIGNTKTLRDILDPKNTAATQLAGFNPYAGQSYTKSHNFKTNESAVLSVHNSSPVFATNNALGYSEFAEEFKTQSEVKLQGVFIASTPVSNISDMSIEIRVYAANNGKPDALLHEQPFSYSYKYYENGGFNETHRDMNRNVENYIEFTKPISVSGNFFISYSEKNGVPDGFSALNAMPRKTNEGISSTAWIKGVSGWVRSSENTDNPINTSLLISPFSQGGTLLNVDPVIEDFKWNAFYSTEFDQIFVNSEKELISWEVFYVSGQKVYEEISEAGSKNPSIPVSNLVKGVYIVKIKTADGSQYARKVMVR